jgi:hypothetical protein
VAAEAEEASAHAVAEPRPEAARVASAQRLGAAEAAVPSVQQPGVAEAAVLSVPQPAVEEAVAAAPDAPRAAAVAASDAMAVEAAVVAQSGAAAVQQRAAALSVLREAAGLLQAVVAEPAAWPRVAVLQVPSAAASVFRQGRLRPPGPAR